MAMEGVRGKVFDTSAVDVAAGKRVHLEKGSGDRCGGRGGFRGAFYNECSAGDDLMARRGHS